MPKNPEREAFRENWARIISAVSNQVSVTEFGNLLIAKNFSAKQTVNNILSVGTYADYDKVTNLMRLVETRVVYSPSADKVAKRYEEFVTLLHDDLGLTDLAQEMVETCRKFYGRYIATDIKVIVNSVKYGGNIQWLV